jgi:hypothetical protein
MCTITPDEKSRVQTFLPTVVSSEQALKPVIFAFERHQVGAAFNHHAGSTEPIAQNILSLCLRDQQDERKTCVRRTNVTEGDCCNRSALDVQFEARTRIASGDELFPQAEHLQQLQRARLDAERTGFTCAIPQSVDDPKPRAECLKLGCQRQSSRTGAND